MNEKVAAAIKACRAFIDQQDDALALPPEGAQFAHALVLSGAARCCVEIGTSYGYSGLWIGAAAQANGGKLITIDKEQRKSDIARAYFADAGIADVADVRTGLALDLLPAVDGPIDFVLNDADKENAVAYFDLVADKLAPGGVFLTDNITTHPQLGETLLPHVRRDARFFTTTVPVGSGMELTVRRR